VVKAPVYVCLTPFLSHKEVERGFYLLEEKEGWEVANLVEDSARKVL